MLQLTDISYRIDNFRLRDISFRIRQGEYLALTGPSGAGKTILLEIIAGLLSPETGKIIFQGKDITRVPAYQRAIGIVFQDMAIFPHLSVAQNIEYPLKGKKLTAARRKDIVSRLAAGMGIEHLLRQNAASLSGGETQRLALARVLAYDPPLILLDEPLSALDDRLKTEISRLLKKIHRQGKTILHVTHDLHNAAALSDRILTIENGMLKND